MNEQNAKAKRSKRIACEARIGYFGLGGITPPAPCKRRAVVVESYEVPRTRIVGRKFAEARSFRNAFCDRHKTKDTSNVISTFRVESL
jgi:hypothetical protein